MADTYDTREIRYFDAGSQGSLQGPPLQIGREESFLTGKDIAYSDLDVVDAMCRGDNKHTVRYVADEDILSNRRNSREFCLHQVDPNQEENLRTLKEIVKEAKEKGLRTCQIWVKRGPKENEIAKFLGSGYYHVMLWIGNEIEIGNEIVDVTKAHNMKANLLKTGLRARTKITKVTVDNYKGADEVKFKFGHHFNNSFLEANVENKIREKALACVGQEFDYTTKQNCEAFVNMVMFGIIYSVQGERFFKQYKSLKIIDKLQRKSDTLEKLDKKSEEILMERKSIDNVKIAPQG